MVIIISDAIPVFYNVHYHVYDKHYCHPEYINETSQMEGYNVSFFGPFHCFNDKRDCFVQLFLLSGYNVTMIMPAVFYGPLTFHTSFYTLDILFHEFGLCLTTVKVNCMLPFRISIRDVVYRSVSKNVIYRNGSITFAFF